MEHKSWPWKKKSTEKTMIATDKMNRENEDELQAVLAYEAELEKKLDISNEKLSAALAEISAKDDIAKKQTNIAREAIQGWEKAEAEVLALKQELEKATQKTVASEERLYGLDAALKECMQQLRFVREEQEKRIHDAVMKTSREYEKARINIEEKFSESTKRLSKLSSENTQLTKALLAKEKMIDELQTVKAQLDSDLSAVMSRLESTQRENASLSYEVRVLEKELEIRNEERDFNRRTAELAHKQHLESVKKIAKLETEAQRLRLLVRKRLPGPAALAKMKNEVELLGRDPTETTRRRSNPFPVASKDFTVEHASDSSGKRIGLLTEQLCTLEEENRVLKEYLNQKANELSKSQTTTGPARHLITTHEFPMAASSSDMGSDEKVSLAESWALSSRTVGASDIGLMDDFVEMEKLAIVSVDKPSSNPAFENHSSWLENILKVISEHARIAQRPSSDVLEDIKVALEGKNNKKRDANSYISGESKDKGQSDELLGDEIPSTKLSKEHFHSDMNGLIQRLIELIEGVRLSGKDDSSSLYKTSETPTGYTVRVLQWKTSELGAVLETFLQSCNSLLNGKAGVEDFAKELTSALDWIVNHCFSLQDVSSMRYEMKKQFDWDETRSDCELEGGIVSHLSEPKDHLPGWPMAASWNIRNNIFHMEEVQTNSRQESQKLRDDLENTEYEKKELEDRLQSEIFKNESLIVQLQESVKTVESLQTEVEALKEQEEEMIKDQIEVDVDVTVKENLDEQLIEAIGEHSEAQPKSTSVEEQEKNNTGSDQEPEAKTLDESIQPESMTEQDMQNGDLDNDEKRLQSEREITAASEKLAECQETILNLGKQLKALASPRHTLPSDKHICNPNPIPIPTSETTESPLPDKTNHRRISLLDKMMAEDASGAFRPLKTKEITRTLTSPAVLDGNSHPIGSAQRFVGVNGIKHQKDEEALVEFLSIVPSKKKKSGGVLKKLLWRRNKSNKK